LVGGGISPSLSDRPMQITLLYGPREFARTATS
jgi:hypothetical protein